MKMLRIDVSTMSICDEVTVTDSTVIDDFYVKTDIGIIPIAHLFPVDKRNELQLLLKEYNEATRVCDNIHGRIMFTELPKLREVKRRLP